MSAAAGGGEVLHCEVIDWRSAPKESTGWHVVQVRSLDGAVLAVTGCHLPRPGTQCEIRGEWQEYRGRLQFYARHVVSARPSLTAEGVMRWLQDRCEGIGPGRAQALLDRFAGDASQLWAALERGPVRGVRGVDDELAQHIYEQFRAEGSQREHYATLRGWGLTQAQIARCLQHWPTAELAVQALQADPYQLAEHISGFGFKRADTVALAMNIAPDSMERVCAAILYRLEELAQLGHVFGDEMFFATLAKDYMQGVSMARIRECIRALRDAGKLRVRDGAQVYLPELMHDELTAAGGYFEQWQPEGGP
jgi:exodeoxyribonuclease V alpha subunit